MDTQKAKISLKNQVFPVKTNTTIRKALVELDLQPDAHLIVRDGTLITDDEILKAGDEIQLFPVISGG